MKRKIVTLEVETDASNKAVRDRLIHSTWYCAGCKTITVKQAQVNDVTPKRKVAAR